MVKEQYLIVKNLPDGALIHRQKMTEPENSRSPNYVLQTAPTDTKIQYFNNTLQNMFNLDIESTITTENSSPSED